MGPNPPSLRHARYLTVTRIHHLDHSAKMSAELGSILAATLSLDSLTRRQAEKSLSLAQSHPDFPTLVLSLAQDVNQQKSIRQSAALSFKNWIKLNWAVCLVFLLLPLFGYSADSPFIRWKMLQLRFQTRQPKHSKLASFQS